MSYQYSTRTLNGHAATSPSPLRHSSTASSGSSANSYRSEQFPPSRTSTLSSHSSGGYQYNGAGHKRGLSQVSETAVSPITPPEDYFAMKDKSPGSTYKSMRESLRPLPQAPAGPAPLQHNGSPKAHSRSKSVAVLEERSSPNGHCRSNSYEGKSVRFDVDGSSSPPAKQRPHSMAISRSDSLRAPIHDRSSRASSPHVHFSTSSELLERPVLQQFGKSSTGHLRTLSKFAEDEEPDFSIKSPDQAVVGLNGRRRLQRSMSTKAKKSQSGIGYGGRNWMDAQRQFLQAYEYLCHIGEAKEWIEDIIHKEIPPIVQLEEALRDGVTLAEVVQALDPDRPFRIFRNPRLQFRHSDNIAIFFRYLAEVELPELFRFELVDLYEKKNIPKVIYCIHALSWLLFRKGIVDFRIGNLVGQLQFEHHELEEMQKGLDKSGVSMPNFSGMSANFDVEPEPEPEPVETEEDRIERELAENEPVIVDLQAQVRGAIVRNRLGDMMQQLWDAEEMLIDLQSRMRGDWARQIATYRLDMKNFAVKLQSAVRGFMVRSREQSKQDFWQASERDVVTLQSLVRANKARQETQFIKSRLQRQQNGVREFQAAIRGAFARWKVGEQWEETRDAEAAVESLQAAIRGAMLRKQVDDEYAESKQASAQIELLQSAARGMLQRRSKRAQQESLRLHESMVTHLQAAVRGALARESVVRDQEDLHATEEKWAQLQAVARALVVRRTMDDIRQRLTSHAAAIIGLQSVARASRQRVQFAATREALKAEESSILEVQSQARGHLQRLNYTKDVKAVHAEEKGITALQAAARGYVERQRTFDVLCALEEHAPAITDLQSNIRAMLLRTEVDNILSRLDAEHDWIAELQAAARGSLVRHKFAEKKRFYKENMEKVVKIQSFIRGRQQGEAYKSLTSGQNPPVGTIKNFVHLLNDSDFDFDEEIEFERLRKTVVQHVRQNEMAEQYIDQLDVKIALLVKNKITLDEVVKHQRHFGGHVGSLLTNKELASTNSFDLKALNKNSRKKLEHYQELFFILQTQPQYLARLFKRIREQGTPEKECKRVETLMMSLFGLAQKRREEYYLLKLIVRSIKEEVDSSGSLQDYLRGNFFWGKVLNSYIRSPRDRKFMRDLLGPLIRENIIDNDGLDLESDPMQIYRSAINNEELRTGQRSRRNPDVPREEAIRDPETRDTFIRHLQDLRDIADQFFAALEDNLPRLPYGIRFVAQQTLDLLIAKFPYEDQQHLLQVVGFWTWKTYLQPALTAPETWGIVDSRLSPQHKRNLSEVSKVLSQVAAGRLFGGENIYLQPLNSYVTEAIGRLGDIWANLVDVRSPEKQFDIDEFNDLYARTKPTLYIKLTDIFAIHNLIASEIASLCPQDDVLREVIRELGSAKNNETEMMGVSTTEISLQLSPKLHDVDDPDAAIKALFMETKRCVLYIIRIQSGANLMEIMVRPISAEDEDKWEQLIHEELSAGPQKRSAYADSATTTLIDITSLTYADLKRTALENILQLERHGRLSRHNHYQDLLNEIALDIRTKHRRRVQRAKELEGVRATLANLDEKARWLDQQLKSYNDYIEQAMVTLQNKKGKKRFLLPFTKQYNHEKELQRAGRVPKFGSYKYSARTLAEKGVLVSWAGYGERQWDKVNLTISSDEVGVFHIEGSIGSMMIPGASASVPLDDLLQAQFNNHQFMNLFGSSSGGTGEGLRLNVNLFLHLVFKKFYRDE